jgi:nucleoside-diphosphate-sugar epimerase
LVQSLIADGISVVCLLRPSSVFSAPEGGAVRVVRGELTDSRAVEEALRGVQVVCHLAAKVSDWGTVAEIRSANVTATEALLCGAARIPLERFVHVSTTDVYRHPGLRDLEESFSGEPPHFNWYAESKREAEVVVRRAEVPWTIVRPATVYGPGSFSMMGEFAQTLRDGFMLWVNQGRSDAGLVYVDDVVHGIRLALEHPAAVHETFNLSDSSGVTWRELIEELARALDLKFRSVSLPFGSAVALGMAMEVGYRGVRQLTGCSMRPLLSRQAVQIMGIDQSFSHAKASRLLGYQPRTDFPMGLARSVAWLKGEVQCTDFSRAG